LLKKERETLRGYVFATPCRLILCTWWSRPLQKLYSNCKQWLWLSKYKLYGTARSRTL